MNSYFLDAGGVLLIGYIVFIFLFIAILIEWIILLLFKLNNPGKLLLFSFIVNMVSLGLGIVLVPVIQRIGNNYTNYNPLWQWIIFLIVSILAEGFLLQLLNKKSLQTAGKTWLAAFIMNLASYLVLLFFLLR